MCMSLRGGTYYGASLHITIGLIFLGGFFVDLLGVAEIWHNPYATYFTLILAFLYICLFIIFGLLIFRGTEKESGKLLKGSIAGFVALQISGFFVYLIILGITNSIKNSRLAAAAAAAKTTPTVSPDLAEIEAILEEASNEIRNSNRTVVSIIEETFSASLTTPAPSLDVDLLLAGDDNQAIISIYQIMIIVFGGIATVAYSAVVIMYFREIDTSTRARVGRF